ncbi:hypothetical protein EN816_00705 [Mesorhizobium sp. M8A.F.Ca.ET.173.01.1.1]|nr:hypothetical protein EN816_00705 [Mesorhizobium sp. M8A.F.Ca.ET.173.01.1.1]
MSYQDWHVGMRVVCVKRQEVGRARDEGVSLPTIGNVYTIRDIEPCDYWPGVCIRLNEVRNGPHHLDGQEPSFYHGWFRPVQTRKTSIAQFERLLNPSKEDTLRELEAEIFEHEPTEVPFR